MTDADYEERCQVRSKDGEADSHCDHWWDGGQCCACGAAASHETTQQEDQSDD